MSKFLKSIEEGPVDEIALQTMVSFVTAVFCFSILKVTVESFLQVPAGAGIKLNFNE